jgi:hypothetical protein
LANATCRFPSCITLPWCRTRQAQLVKKNGLQNEAILLMHFSARYKPDDILRLLDQELPAFLRPRVYPFLQGFSLL